ncbi:7-carboxy-7-deazaguanine synthase QueE [Thalassospira marina]|uniref:7-carboxy-7-deazaguanine synthase n=1 Tax=Thalassospira marina TaxID=2048283 RepID=A0ABM6QAQ4_9PROT|nr:7-carboxy-7-deazaguanine synthase QueE [Thalassospira marina]AUG53656.1 7-carboxy-7-deazaguanine synthase QueE [Thalassospira marina]
MTQDITTPTCAEQGLQSTDLSGDDSQLVRRQGKIRISEIFGPTVQGEGALLGMPTVFVRTGGCDFRCSWCDTLYAVDPAFRGDWLPMDAEAILDQVKKLSGGRPVLVTLSGGNPAIQPLESLIDKGQRQGFTFAIETQGSIARRWFARLDHLTLSPKPPSSGTVFNADDLAACITAARSGSGMGPVITLKFPVADEADLNFANQVRAMHPDIPCYLQPVNATPAAPHPDGADGVDIDALTERYRWLVDRVAQNGWFDVRVMPQWHVHVWGNLRGV